MFSTTANINSNFVVSLKIEHGHKVSWLSELREVSVLFINLEPAKQLNASDTLKLLQSSFDIVYPSLANYDGEFSLP